MKKFNPLLTVALVTSLALTGLAQAHSSNQLPTQNADNQHQQLAHQLETVYRCQTL